MASSFSKLFKPRRESSSTINSREIISKISSFNNEIAKNHLPKIYQTSPTQSDFNSINVIIKEFEINKDHIRKEFYSTNNNEKRQWYFKTFTKQQVTEFREKWYQCMILKETNIPFFTWFETYSIANEINYPFKEINTSTTLSQVWERTDGMKTSSIHPPLTDLKIQTSNRQIIATPFKTGANQDDKEVVNKQDIKCIYQQNNYQSQILHTIAKQVDSIDNKLENYKEEQLSQHPFSSTSSPLFKVSSHEIKFQKNELLASISSRLEKLDRGKNILYIDENENTNESDVNEQDINRIRNRNMKSKKPYYSRHTPPDLLFEENKRSANIYTGDGIYEWNIDGKSEYEIMKLFQEMGMAAIAFKAVGQTDKQACTILVTGFTGALKYWWDNSLDTYTQTQILNHVEKMKIETEDGFYEETERQNAVEVLIHTLTMHFIGNPVEEIESKKIILTNLRCPTLGDFKWYKDVFITNIFQRKDCNQSFWKERFVAGLPTFFAERILTKIKEYSGGNQIPWDTITYGQLISFIKKEGLTICQEQKDKKRNDKFKFKLNMGEFCKQYGFEKYNPPSRIKRSKHLQNRKFTNNKYGKFHNKDKHFGKKQTNQYYSKNKNYKNKQYGSKQNIVCWNCKRPGHRSNECKMKKKINEIFQDQPDIQEKLVKLLISDSESETESNYSLNEIENSSDSSTESQESSESFDNLCQCKTINVITSDKDKQFLLDIIEKIDDPETKKQYLLKLKDIITKENKFSIPEPFSLQKIYEKYPTQSLFKQITTGELQTEIKQLKSQIKELQLVTNDQALKQLQIDARLSLIENYKSQASTSNTKIEEDNTQEDYIQIIDKISYQKWYRLLSTKTSIFQEISFFG